MTVNSRKEDAVNKTNLNRCVRVYINGDQMIIVMVMKGKQVIYQSITEISKKTELNR